MTLKVTHLDLVHPKKATDSLTRRNPTKTHAHPLNRSNLSEYLQLKNSSSLRAPWLPAGTGFSHINCLLCFRDMRHEAWKKPRADNCELGDWARKKANHCSIGNSLSLAWPWRHGCQLGIQCINNGHNWKAAALKVPNSLGCHEPSPFGHLHFYSLLLSCHAEEIETQKSRQGQFAPGGQFDVGVQHRTNTKANLKARWGYEMLWDYKLAATGYDLPTKSWEIITKLKSDWEKKSWSKELRDCAARRRAVPMEPISVRGQSSESTEKIHSQKPFLIFVVVDLEWIGFMCMHMIG